LIADDDRMNRLLRIRKLANSAHGKSTSLNSKLKEDTENLENANYKVCELNSS
jgi:hypothetical protein